MGPGFDIGAEPASITTGPDGALWFAESGADKIGRIVMNGAITEFPLPGINKIHADPEGISPGADGGIWFGEVLAYNVGRIDARSHGITEFPLPGGGGTIVFSAIALGPDGALWFPLPGLIGRMTTNGMFDHFPAAFVGAGGREGIARGPDEALWFTESRANKIGRMTTSGELTEFLLPTPDAGLAQIALGPDKALWFTEEGTNKIGRIKLQ
jgi:virginiamycin B lyase